MNPAVKLSDLCTIVPAVTTAWLHVFERYFGTDENGTEFKEYYDAVLPVLAYATTAEGRGAFLVFHEEIDGPSWCHCPRPSFDHELKIGERPQPGDPPESKSLRTIIGGHKYVCTMPDLDFVEWICD